MALRSGPTAGRTAQPSGRAYMSVLGDFRNGTYPDGILSVF